MKMDFIEHDVITMYAELAAIHEAVHKHILVTEIAASYRLYQMLHLSLLKKLTAWRRNNGLIRAR